MYSSSSGTCCSVRLCGGGGVDCQGGSCLVVRGRSLLVDKEFGLRYQVNQWDSF